MAKKPIGFLTPEQERIAALELEYAELEELNHELQKRIMELEAIIRHDKTPVMKFESPFYYAENDKVPHCPRCWEVDKKAVHFPPPHMCGSGPVYTCQQCNKRFIYPHSQPHTERPDYPW